MSEITKHLDNAEQKLAMLTIEFQNMLRQYIILGSNLADIDSELAKVKNKIGVLKEIEKKERT